MIAKQSGWALQRKTISGSQRVFWMDDDTDGLATEAWLFKSRKWARLEANHVALIYGYNYRIVKITKTARVEEA